MTDYRNWWQRHMPRWLRGRPYSPLLSYMRVVCPGIRPAGGNADNHLSPTTPLGALENGADYLVVGRPITQASDPVAATQAILQEMGEAR